MNISVEFSLSIYPIIYPPGRLKGAQTGHRLLKKKADALQLKFRSILKKIIETKQLMGELMKEASFSLAEAKFASTGDLNQAVLQNVNKAQIKVKTKNDNVAGVNLPVFESYQDGADSYELAGLAKGGQQLKRMKVGVCCLNNGSKMSLSRQTIRRQSTCWWSWPLCRRHSSHWTR